MRRAVFSIVLVASLVANGLQYITIEGQSRVLAMTDLIITEAVDTTKKTHEAFMVCHENLNVCVEALKTRTRMFKNCVELNAERKCI